MTIFEEAVAAAINEEHTNFHKLIQKGKEQNDFMCMIFDKLFFRYMIKQQPTRIDKLNYIKENYDTFYLPISYEEYANDVYNEDSIARKKFYEKYGNENPDLEFIDWYLVEYLGIPADNMQEQWFKIISRRNVELKMLLIKAIQNMDKEELLAMY